MPKHWPARIVAFILLLIFTVVTGWALMYPSASDPKNLKYVLWKDGLYKMNLDVAADTMIGDDRRERLVVGKTKPELRNEFGYLLTSTDASAYLRECYRFSPWKNDDVLFIRRSPWMIVFDGDRATNLILIKGC